jgi:transcriptional regulator with XRE-family HTH domain
MNAIPPSASPKTQPLPLAARVIVERRRALGLSQAAVADATTFDGPHPMLSQRAISHLETGTTPLAGVDLGRALLAIKLLANIGLTLKPKPKQRKKKGG